MSGEFLAPEAALITRLEEKLTAASNAARVFTAAQMATIEERAQITPALYIVFEGYTPTQDVNGGRVQQIEQSWTITVAVRNASGQGTGSGVRAAAVPLIELVLAALCGWKPDPAFSGMALADGPGPLFSEGYGYFPLRFTTRTHVRGTV